MADELVIAGRAFRSRLIVGTGKYRSFAEMAQAHAASGADMVTVGGSTAGRWRCAFCAWTCSAMWHRLPS